jgi:ribA/ribD-fused uncharacterized protein
MSERLLPIRDNYALFWGQWPSNWEHSPMVIDGVNYNCVEQWMMAEKARIFGDQETLGKILSATHPSEQKKLGRQVRGFNEAKWVGLRYGVVLCGTLEKYRQNEHLRNLLLEVPDHITFVEASPEDRVWGIGMKRDDPRATDPSLWLGLNLLGKAINEARAILRGEYA